LYRLKPDVAEHIRDLLAEAAGFESLFLRTDPSPWTGAKLPDGAAVERALDLVFRATTQTFPAFVPSLHAVVQQSGLRWPASVSSARELVDLVAAVQATLELYKNDVYARDHASLLRSLERGKSGRLSAWWAWLMSSAYRHARRVVRALRSAGPAPVSRLFAELTDAQRQSTHWIGQAENGSSPCLVADFASHKKNSDALFSDAAVIASVLPEMPTEQLTVDDVGNLLTRLALTTQPRNKFQSLRRLKRDLTLLE